MINVPLAAEQIFRIGSFPVTNALLNALIASLMIIGVSFLIRVSVREIPTRMQNFVEMLIEWLFTFFDQVTHDRALSKKFLPIVGTFFIFILLSNWMGLLPGTGSIGIWHEVRGELEFVPLFRPANSDLNLTIALGVLAVVLAHVMAIRRLGIFRHLNKFVQLGTLWKAVKTFNPIKMITALVEFIVGIIEIFGELAKIASLSLRLFGNIFAGEVLMTVIASLVAFIVPLPFMGIEILVGLIQAGVFSMLTLVYLTVLSMEPHGDHEKEHVHAALPVPAP